MTNPLSPLSTSHQNARIQSPKLGSSPFLTKTLDQPTHKEHMIPSSPLKKSWTTYDARSSIDYESNENYPSHEVNENDEINDNDDFPEPASSPFQAAGREDTVDFQKLQEYQRTTSSPRHQFRAAEPEEPMSSPFRSDARDETVDFQKLREVQPFSPALNNRLMTEDPMSSPFRPEGKDDTVDFEKLREVQGASRAFDDEPYRIESSPFRAGAREETTEFEELHESQHESRGHSKRSSLANDLPSKEDTTGAGSDMQNLRKEHRVSDGKGSTPATSRKRSFDQTPQDLEDDFQAKERCRGIRAEESDIHVDVHEESSVIHNQSFTSAANDGPDRSAIVNSVMEDKRNEGMSTVLHEDDVPGSANKENLGHISDFDHSAMHGEDDHDPMDDTGLSNFSVLPDMTSFAGLRAESPLKSFRGSVAPSSSRSTDKYRCNVETATPSAARRSYRSSALHDASSPIGSPTPRRRASRDIGNPNETPNLLDLTDQMNFLPRHSMQQNARYSPSRRSPLRSMRQSSRSPSKLSLLDFDIPPAPTPRSIPTITPRELESLKSGFMSEISSLKATLSGKEAEVASLKQAIADAERRVGEALEEVRNEAARKEELEAEQAEWDRRGNEMETVLRSVRSELVEGERERDRLTRKAEEAEKSKEQLEGRVVELESQLSAARSSATSESGSAQGSRAPSQTAEDTAREVQDAVEKVARELHTLYKGKHETKVAALKKSYESRWEKRLREAENKLATAREENERLKVERDAVQSDTMAAANASMIARENDEHETEKRVFEAQIKGLQHEMAALKEDSERLRFELKSERAEKGELVAAVDEWLAMQQGQAPPAQQAERESSTSSAGHHETESRSSEAPPDTHRRSVSRSGPSSLRAPATGEKRLPRYGAPGGHSRGNSGGKSGIAVFTPGRGGIMSSIERMGRGGA